MSFLQNTRAATTVEYALLVGLIAIVSIAAIAAVGTNVRCLFEQVASALANVTGGSYMVSAECGGGGVAPAGGGTPTVLNISCPAGEYLAGITNNLPDCLPLPAGGGITSEIDPRNLATIADDGNLCRANDQAEIVCDQERGPGEEVVSVLRQTYTFTGTFNADIIEGADRIFPPGNPATATENAARRSACTVTANGTTNSSLAGGDAYCGNLICNALTDGARSAVFVQRIGACQTGNAACGGQWEETWNCFFAN